MSPRCAFTRVPNFLLAARAVENSGCFAFHSRQLDGSWCLRSRSDDGPAPFRRIVSFSEASGLGVAIRARMYRRVATSFSTGQTNEGVGTSRLRAKAAALPKLRSNHAARSNNVTIWRPA
jgi:hypothetical protein